MGDTSNPKISIMIKLAYSEILDIFGVPKVTLCLALHFIFPSLKFNYLKHLWYPIDVLYV